MAWAEDFTIILLPDTQNYSEFFPQVFRSQTQWIADNETALNIKMVLGLGDIVNHGDSTAEWQNADAAMRLIEGKVPYLLAIGNHDYDGTNPSRRSATKFNSYFGPPRYAGRPWYGANLNGSNENFYGSFQANGKTYLVLVLEYVPRNFVLDWANSIADANADKEIIVVTHTYMYKDNTRVDACDTNDMAKDNDGDETWNKFVSKHPNIIMVVNGHITSGSGGRRSDLGDSGNLVNQMLSNFQTWPNGGNGYLRILTFHPLQNTIDVKTYSPWLNKELTTDPRHKFTLSYHNPGFSTGAGTLSGRARQARRGTTTDCQAIAGVKVAAGGKLATTDSAGNYSLTLAPSTYNATASASGWNTLTLPTMVHDGYTSDLEFFLTAGTVAGSCTPSATKPSVKICTPSSGATVTSPVRVTAAANSVNSVNTMQIYVDGTKVFQKSGSTVDTSLTMAVGTRRLTVKAWDSTNTGFQQTIYITVR